MKLTNLSKGLIPLFLFFLLAFSIYGAKPLTTTDIQYSPSQTLIIEYPKIDAIERGETYKLHFHIYNTTGSLIDNRTNLYCSLHIYNNLGSHIVEQEGLIWDSNGIEQKYDFTETNRVGVYPYVIGCNTSLGKAGFLSSNFYVTSTGFPNSENYGIILFTIYMGLMLGLLFLIHTFKKDSSTILVYGILGATLSFIFLALMLGGLSIIEGVTFIIDINYYIGALVTGLGLYMGVIGFTFYSDLKEGNK